jgi:hypothetical protein
MFITKEGEQGASNMTSEEVEQLAKEVATKGNWYEVSAIAFGLGNGVNLTDRKHTEELSQNNADTRAKSREVERGV